MKSILSTLSLVLLLSLTLNVNAQETTSEDPTPVDGTETTTDASGDASVSTDVDTTVDTTSDGTTDDTADTTSDGTTDDTADTTSDGTTDDTADTTSDGTTDDTADTTSDGTTDDTADTTSDGTTDDTADTTTDETTGDETSDEATDETTGDETSDEATDETTGDETSDEATDETTGDETSDEATDETTGDETSDEATDETTGDETSDETADESNGEITLEFIVEGFVYDESDQALPDVEVTLGELSATSNEEGYYQIVGLTAGTYTLAGEKTDYVFENQQLTLDDENPVVAVNLRSIAGGKIEGSQLIVVGAYVCESNNTVSFATGSGDSLYQFDPEFSSKGVVLSSADFNSDDSTDVAVGAKDEGNDVYLFDAKGERFVTIITNSNEEGANTQFGDFDGDGVLEIVVAEQSPGSRLYLYESTGEAIRALPIFDDETAFNFALGDVNNDGSDEIVVTLATTSEGEDNVYIYQNDGTLLGSFKALAMGDTAPGLVVSVSNVEGDDSAEIVVGIAEDDMDYKVGVYTYGGDLLNDFTVFASLSSDDETVSSNRVTRDDDDGRSDDDDDDDNDGRSDDDDDDDDNDGRSDDDDDDDDNDSRSDDDDDDDDNDSRSDDDDDNDDQGESSDDERVSICHKGRKTITVAASAVPAHLAHGDSRGACGSNDGNTDEDDGRDDDNIVTACTLSSLEGLLLTTGDLDGDGFAEIIVGKAGAQEVRVYTPAGELSERFNAVENTATLTALSYGEKMAVELPVVSELPEDPEAPLEDITVIGEEDAPVIIEDREIQGTVRVAHAIIVNIRISVGARLVVGPGVKFRTPKAIPVGLNLTSVFPKINMSARVQSFTTTFEAVDLSSTSVVEDAPPVLDDIQVILEDDEIEQNPENGNLEVDQGDTRYTVAPVSVEQAAEDEAPGVSIEDDGSVVFITLRGQKVKAQPVPQEPTSFVTALSQFSFSQLKMSVTGQLNVLENTDLGRRTGRADLFSNLVVTTGVSLGGFAIESSYISNRTVSGYRFLDEQGRMWQQLIYPTAAYPEMLFDLSDGESNASDVELYQDGIIFFSLGANTHTGVLGYEILSGSTSVSTGVEFSFMSDMNADGIEDAMITYPTGETQVIYLLD